MAEKPQAKGGNQTKPKEVPRARSFLRDDFPFIRNASITLLVCILIAAALVSGSEYMFKKEIQAKAAVQPIYDQAREKYLRAENEKREIHDFQPKYKQLIAKGFIGEEKRLDWMEGIKRIQAERALPPIEYEISAQQPFQEDPTLETGALELRASKMAVKMSLLHEVDLLDFLDDLKSTQAYALHDCNIKRARFNIQDKLASRLYAECSLYWITLGRRAGADGDNPSPTAATQ
jgi:hypothetical protein